MNKLIAILLLVGLGLIVTIELLEFVMGNPSPMCLY